MYLEGKPQLVHGPEQCRVELEVERVQRVRRAKRVLAIVAGLASLAGVPFPGQ